MFCSMWMRASLCWLLLWQALRHEPRQGYETFIGKPFGKDVVRVDAIILNLSNATTSRTFTAGIGEEQQSDFTHFRGEDFMPHAMRRRMTRHTAEPFAPTLRTKWTGGLAIASVVRQDVLNAAGSAAHFLLKFVTGDGWISFWQALFWICTTCLHHKTLGSSAHGDASYTAVTAWSLLERMNLFHLQILSQYVIHLSSTLRSHQYAIGVYCQTFALSVLEQIFLIAEHVNSHCFTRSSLHHRSIA